MGARAPKFPGSCEHARRAGLGAARAWRGGNEVPEATGQGHRAFWGPAIPDREVARARLDWQEVGGTAPPRDRRDLSGEEKGRPALAVRRRRQCQDRQVLATHCSGSRSPPTPPPGWEGVSGDVTGGDYSLVSAVVWLPLTGRVGGPPPPGRPPRAAPSAPQPAPRAHASAPPRAPGSKVRLNFDALSPPPPGRSSAAAANQAAAAAARQQPRDPKRRSAATAARGSRCAHEWAPTGARRTLSPERACPRGRRELGPLNGNRSSIDWAPPGGRGCPGKRVRKAEGQEVGVLQQGWRDRAGTEPSLFMCLASARLLPPKT